MQLYIQGKVPWKSMSAVHVCLKATLCPESKLVCFPHRGILENTGAIIIYRVAVAKEINCILHWALPVCTGTHLRTSPLPERWVLTCTPLSVTMLNAGPYARRLLAGTWRRFRYWTSLFMGGLPAHSGIYSNAMYLCSCYMQAPPNLPSVALPKHQEACDGPRTLQQHRQSF